MYEVVALAVFVLHRAPVFCSRWLHHVMVHSEPPNGYRCYLQRIVVEARQPLHPHQYTP